MEADDTVVGHSFQQSRRALRGPWAGRSRQSPRGRSLGHFRGLRHRWEDLGGDGSGLAEEALFHGRLVVSLLPDEPEAQGLLALMLYCESRREARRDSRGELVPLSEQDPSLWYALHALYTTRFTKPR